jgi:hypothetical protein
MEGTRDEKTVPFTDIMKSLSFGRLSDMVAKHMPSSGFPGTGALFLFLRSWMVLFTVLIECVPSKEGRKGGTEGRRKEDVFGYSAITCYSIIVIYGDCTMNDKGRGSSCCSRSVEEVMVLCTINYEVNSAPE